QDHLARARLVEVDRALVAQLLELPGLERQTARDADARERHRQAVRGGVLDARTQLDAFTPLDVILRELRGDGDLRGLRRLRARRAVVDRDRVRQRRRAGELDLDRVLAGLELAREVVPHERVLATLLERDRARLGAIDDQRRRAARLHLLRVLG